MLGLRLSCNCASSQDFDSLWYSALCVVDKSQELRAPGQFLAGSHGVQLWLQVGLSGADRRGVSAHAFVATVGARAREVDLTDSAPCMPHRMHLRISADQEGKGLTFTKEVSSA